MSSPWISLKIGNSLDAILRQCMLHEDGCDRNVFLLFNWHFSFWDFHPSALVLLLRPACLNVPFWMSVESCYILLSCLLFRCNSPSSFSSSLSGMILSPLTCWLFDSSFSLSLILLKYVVQIQRWGLVTSLFLVAFDITIYEGIHLWVCVDIYY